MRNLLLALIIFFGSEHKAYAEDTTFSCNDPRVSMLDKLGITVYEEPITIALKKGIYVGDVYTKTIFAVKVKSVEASKLGEKYQLQGGDLILKTNSHVMSRPKRPFEEHYFKNQNANEQMEGRFHHNVDEFTLSFKRPPSSQIHMVIIRNPRIQCQTYKKLYVFVENLSSEIGRHFTNSRIAPIGSGDFTQYDLSKKLQAQKLPTPPVCQEGGDESFMEKCRSLITQIKDLDGRTPILQTTLDDASAIEDQDAKPLEEDRLKIYAESVDLMRRFKESQWDEESMGIYLQQIKDLDSRWQELKVALIQYQGKHAKEAREYTALWKAWEEDFKNISKQLNELQIHKQTAARKKEEAERDQVRVAKNQALESMIERHGAKDLTTSPQLTLSLTKNPFAYKDGNVFIQGLYVKNIEEGQALIDLAPLLSLHEYVIQMATNTNLALQQSMTRCVVEVMGTTNILQGGIERQIPHVKEVECLP